MNDAHSIYMMNDIKNYGQNIPQIEKFRSELIALAMKSVNDESKKYKDALDMLMRERAKVYLMHRVGKNVNHDPSDVKDIKHIMEMNEYK